MKTVHNTTLPVCPNCGFTEPNNWDTNNAVLEGRQKRTCTNCKAEYSFVANITTTFTSELREPK